MGMTVYDGHHFVFKNELFRSTRTSCVLARLALCNVESSVSLPLIQVSRLAGVLVKNGVQKGDLVVIYMPMVPQAMFTMLACARIGAPHSLIFGGFASKELSVRIDHAKVRILCFSLCIFVLLRLYFCS